ncbi:MAG: tetratricopeptide repeat protein, partial [Dehalococcoidia bacterium]
MDRNLEALAARRAVDDRQLVGNTLNDLGLGFRDVARDLPKALEYYRESEQVRREIGDSLALSRLLPNMGRVFEGLGDYSKAREYYLDGGAMYLAVGDTARWIGQMSNTAGLLTDYADRHAEALAILLSLEKALDRSGDARARAVVLSNAGIIRRRLGDFEGAVVAYREAIRLSEENGFEDLLAKAYNNLGVLYIFLERSQRAVPMLERALERTDADDYEGQADALLSLSSAHFQMRDYDQARKYSALADAVVLDPVRRAKAIKMRADIELRDGDPAAAIPAFEELLALGTRLEVPMLVSDGHFGLAEALERSGRAAEAVEAYDEALETLESARGRLYTQEDKAGYLAQARYLYEEVLHFLTRQAIGSAPVGQVAPEERLRFAEKAFEVAERGKARAFLDQMAEALAGVREGVDPGLQEDLEALSQNMATLRERLAVADPDSQAAEIGELKGLVGQMESEYERVERAMRAQNPRFAALRYPDPVTAAELRAEVLRPGELLLQYSLGDSSSTLWAVTRQGLSIHRLPVRSEIENLVQVLRFALENPGEGLIDRFSVPARALFEQLVAPVA